MRWPLQSNTRYPTVVLPVHNTIVDYDMIRNTLQALLEELFLDQRLGGTPQRFRNNQKRFVFCRVHVHTYRSIPAAFSRVMPVPATSVSCLLCETPIRTRTRNFSESCTTFIPVPETSISSVRPSHNTRGTGTYNIRSHNRNFCEFCTTSIPHPELLWAL